MKIWTTILAGLLAAGWACVGGAAPPSPSVESAIQSIQQAPDPSAAVTAFANGFAVDRNNPRLYDAYVSRMVDLGLPELAYHQAQTLTTLQNNNGLAWGVVGFVDARRAQMSEALSAINLAGQYAPDNKFVQHTAGELAAWYDYKADKSTIPENTRDGLMKVRRLLQQQPTFTEAYGTAQKAYQTSTAPPTQPGSSAPAPGVSAPGATNAAAPTYTVPNAPQVPPAPQVQSDLAAPLSYGAPTPVAPYYPDYSSPYSYPNYGGVYAGWGPDYYYGGGPGWVSPTPWWWWQPYGWWGGCSFYPFGAVFVFDNDGHHHHHGHDGDGHHNGHSGHGSDPANWHHGSGGHNSFFGTPAHPSDSVTHWAHATSVSRTTGTANSLAASTGSGWWRPTAQSSAVRTPGSSAVLHSTQPSVVNRGPALSSRTGGSSTFVRTPQPSIVNRSPTITTRPAGNTGVGRQTPQGFVNRSPAVSAPTTRPWTGNSGVRQFAPTRPNSGFAGNAWAPSYTTPRTTWSSPSYRTPAYSSPRFSTPSPGFSSSAGSFRGYSGMSAAPHSFSGGFSGARGGSSVGGGFHSGAAMGGGGFHSGGGAMSGGGHGGGGHR